MVGVPIVLNILLLVLGVAGGYLESRRLMACQAGLALEGVLKRAPYLAVLIPLILLWIIGLVFINSLPSLTWYLPVWLDFYSTALIWGSLLLLFAFSFSLTVAVAFRTRHAERWKLASAGILLVLTVQYVQWQYTRPVAPSLTHVTTSDGVILQSSGVSCAAAAGANIVRHFGLEKTERNMAELFGTTTRAGTSAAQVMYGMHQLGIASHKVEIPDADLTHLTVPAMLFVDHPVTGPETHAVAYMALHQGKAEVWDPLVGKRWLTQPQLAQIWHGHGLVFASTDGRQ